MGRKKGMSTKNPEEPLPDNERTLTDYEKERCATMEKNRKVFEKLGLAPLVKQLRGPQNGNGRKTSSGAKVYDKDPNYMPSDEALESEEDEDENTDDTVTMSGVEPTKGENRKQTATTTKRKKQQMCPAMSMIDYLKQQQKEKEATTQHPQEAYEKQQPQESSQNNGEPTTPLRASGAATAEHTLASRAVTVVEEMGDQIEQRRRSKRQASISQHGSRRPADNLDIIVAEQSNDASNETEVDRDKKSRGRTMLFDVHARKMDNRVAVLFNEKGQPIGPTKKVASEFSLFLGTIAHAYTLAPLTYTSWHKVPHKDRMWGYVNEKYIIPSTAKKWVLQSIGHSWRGYKCRIKKAHFRDYETNSERWKNRPVGIPDDHFKLLLQYWSNSIVQKISDENADNRSKHDNMHTMGPVSFARKRSELKKEDGQSPSKTRMFAETRKRKQGRTYKLSNDDTLDKIKRMKALEALQESGLSSDTDDPFDKVMKKAEHHGRLRLYGKGVCARDLKAVGVDKPQPLAPEFIDAIKAGLGEEMQKDFDAHKEKMDAELQAEKDKVTNMQKEIDAQKVELDDQKAELGAQMAKVNRLLALLQKLNPDIAHELNDQAEASPPVNTTQI